MNVNDACWAYGFAQEEMGWKKPDQAKNPVEKSFFEVAEKLKPLLCDLVKMDKTTSWEKLLSLSGIWLADQLSGKEQQGRFEKTFSIKLGDKAKKLYQDLDEWRYQITGKV
ncbi:MAG: hypothetical protein KAV41_00950 [Candidatus Pacebacteria bacterium]|nr:hypothetical protein [Candidatus Paceibacterota bacterium]